MRTHRIGVEAASARKARSVPRSGSRHVGRGQAPGGRPLPAHGAVTPPPRGRWAHPQGHVPHSPRPLSEHSWYHRPGHQMCQDQRDTRPRCRATPHSTAASGLAAASQARARRCHCLGSGGGQHPSPQRAWLFSKESTPAKQPQVRHSAVAGGDMGKAGCLSCAVLRLSALSCVRPFLSRVATRSMWALQMLPTAASDPARLVCSPLPEPLSRGDHGSCQGRPVLSCAAQMSLVWPRAAHTAQHTPEKAEEEQLPAPACRPGAVAPSEVQDTAC